uniref:Uncharacterized protein n=1 Tax=Medicago truncatula TaxID=3880 RepID=A2Q1F5_MEDTR|nr:hypothetical protein MtrDRAFT_AC148815g36v2 [Medicago truncatula]
MSRVMTMSTAVVVMEGVGGGEKREWIAVSAYGWLRYDNDNEKECNRYYIYKLGFSTTGGIARTLTNHLSRHTIRWVDKTTREIEVMRQFFFFFQKPF